MVEPLTGDDPREAGGFRLRGRLGSGAMGQVYLALTPGGRQVALKMVRAGLGDDEQFRARFRQEVAAAQRVHGLFTAQVLEADPGAPRPWLATSYVPGLSLRQAVSRYGPLPAETVFLLLAGIAEALQAIHAAGIIHRDLKPSNVILAADGPRVIDFGIAQAAAAPALTRSGSWVGSPPFMAPEQARGRAVTPAADVFSLGSLAVYAAAGHPPFGTGGAVAVLNRVLHEPPDLDGCPPGLRPLIGRCLAKDPAQRPGPGHIISACRDQAAGGGLTFGRSWLPAQVAAAAAADPGLAAPVSAAADGTVLPAVLAASPGDVRDGGTGPEATSPSEEAVAAPALAAPAVAAPALAAPAPAPAPAVAVSAPPGDPGAGPGPPEPLSAALPATPAASRKTKTSRAPVIGAVLLLVVAAGAIAAADLGSHPGPGAGRGPAAAGPARSGPGRRAAGPGPQATPVSAASGREPATSASARLRTHPTAGPRPAPPAASSPAPAPPGTSPSPEVTPSGRAAFDGTWAGTVSEPGWSVPSWTVQLSIPASASPGSYSAPSTGCSGSVSVHSGSGSSLTATAATTTLLDPACVLLADVTLTITGPGQLSMTWVPAGHPGEPGTAVLTRS